MSLLEARDLAFAYAGRPPAVRGISLTAEKGEMVALCGPNGAGKSTLLQLLTGHLPLQSGTVTLGGRDVTSLRPKARARLVTLVPQTATGLLEAPLEEMVSLGRLARQSLAERFLLRPQSDMDRRAVEAALSDTDLAHLRGRRVRELSGGERERARIAMAFAQDAEILCLDEPSAHMDPGHAADVMAALTRKAREGRAVVVALHDLNLASLWASRLVLMAEGAVVSEGPASEVLTAERVHEVFGPHLTLGRHPWTGRPVIFPRGA